MVQFDVHSYRVGPRRRQLVVDVQSNLLSDMVSRVVVPLYPQGPRREAVPRLNPVFDFEGRRYWLAVQDMASVHAKDLGDPVMSLAGRRAEIVAALDLLFTGI